MLGVSLDQVHSIRFMDHLMVVAYYTFSLMFFTCWPIFIHLDHLQSFFVFKSAKDIFRVLGLIRSRVSSIRFCQVSTTIISIITCSVIDFSSKPCFEEKQSFYVSCTKFHVISFSLYVIILEVALVTLPSLCNSSSYKRKKMLKHLVHQRQKVKQTAQNRVLKIK